MIRVLLVDDEEMALDHLDSLIDWSAYGFWIVGKARSAETAMRLFRTQRPDLIITDVRMPGITGLDFIEEVRRSNSKVHVLFLSGYENFEYARRAVRLGSDDYLLKSDLSEDVLLSRLLSLKEKIDKEKERDKYTIGTVLTDLFQGTHDEQYYQKILNEGEFVRILRRYYYVLFAVRKVPDFVQDLIADYDDDIYTEEDTLEQEMRIKTEETDLQLVTSFQADTRTHVAVLELDHNITSTQEIARALKEYANNVCEKSGGGERRVYAFFETQKKTIINFRENWKKIRTIVLNGYLGMKNAVRELDVMQENQKSMTELEDWTIEQLSSELKEGKNDRCAKCIFNIENAVINMDSVSYFWYVKLLLTVLSGFNGKTINQETKMQFSLYERSGNYSLYEPTGMLAYLKEKTKEVQNIYAKQHDQHYSENVSKAIHFIQNKYMDPKLSVAKISEQVGFSEAWLSTKFKDEVGIGVSDYINSVRITNAKKMLLDPDIMIYEVSEQCGFTSSQYFSKVFKGLVGVTPNRYQKGLLK